MNRSDCFLLNLLTNHWCYEPVSLFLVTSFWMYFIYLMTLNFTSNIFTLAVHGPASEQGFRVNQWGVDRESSRDIKLSVVSIVSNSVSVLQDTEQLAASRSCLFFWSVPDSTEAILTPNKQKNQYYTHSDSTNHHNTWHW